MSRSIPILTYHHVTPDDLPGLRKYVVSPRVFTAQVGWLVGGPSLWLRDELGMELPLIDWATARQIDAAGFTCASHTLTHPRLAELSAEACRRAIARRASSARYRRRPARPRTARSG